MSEEMHEELGTIAVVGMACRYPGAPDLRTFWENLRNGVESISFFSDHELEEVSPDLASLPNYVKAQGVVADIDLFDAAFFGLTHKEAGIMDPQQRFILECGWQALEHAGYDPDAFDGALGVFAGADLSGYLFGLREDPDLARVSLRGRRHPVAGRALPRLRRPGQGNHRGQRRRVGGPETHRRRA